MREVGYKEKPFHHEDSQVLEQVAQSDCAVSSLRCFQDPMDKALGSLV